MGRVCYVPSLLCAEFVMGRVCHMPSFLCAESSLNGRPSVRSYKFTIFHTSDVRPEPKDFSCSVVMLDHAEFLSLSNNRLLTRESIGSVIQPY